MKKIFYECEETGIIAEKEYIYHAQFSTVKKYPVLYREAMTRFMTDPRDIYGVPFPGKAPRTYLGTDREGLDVYDQYRQNLTGEEAQLIKKLQKNHFVAEEMMRCEESAKTFLKLFAYADDYELIWTRLSGSDEAIPDGYRFLGYDISYPVDCGSSFSIICDCMFICRWHGCDEEGTLFLEDFNKLNENGLFDRWQDAYDYMVKYLNEDWTERGTYGIYEVYMR